MSELLKVKEIGLTEEQARVIETLKAQGVLVSVDLDTELVNREVEYYAENEKSVLEDTESAKEKFKELLQQEYDNIYDREFICRLWTQVVELTKEQVDIVSEKFKEGDRVYHRNLEMYGTFMGYAWESDEECDVEFETEYGLEQKHVSVSWLSKAHKM